jgi:hypothetical protein
MPRDETACEMLNSRQKEATHKPDSHTESWQ